MKHCFILYDIIGSSNKPIMFTEVSIMKIKRIIISSLLIASVTASSGCSSDSFAKKTDDPKAGAQQMVYAPELNPNVHELITDHPFKSLESDEPLRFETAVTPDEATSGTPVELSDSSGKVISKMYDDGTHSDRIAGDGIYTCSYKPKPDGETSFSYSARIGGTSTEPTSVRYFDKITDQDINDMNAVNNNISDIQSEYLDSNGYVPDDKRETVLDAVGEYLKELYNKGEAVVYRVNKEYDNVVVKLNSGITYVYSTPIAGLESGTGTVPVSGSGTTSSTSGTSYNVKKLNVRGFRPYATNTAEQGEGLRSSIALIEKEFSPNIKADTVIEDANVSPKTIDTFGPDQVILWRGHGGYDGYVHSFISTSAFYSIETKDDYDNDDLIEDRLLLGFVPTDNDLIHDGYIYYYPVSITAEYINYHCPDMSNSFIYLGICYGAKDSVLAASFINKKCNVFIGFSDSVYTQYDSNIMVTLVNKMCEKSTSNSKEYNTVLEALNAATSLWGEKDSSGWFLDLFRTPSKPVIFGNRDYRFADAINDTVTDIRTQAKNLGSLRLGSTYIRVNEFDRVTVPVEEYPQGCDWFDGLIWTSDNEKIAQLEEYGVVFGVSKGQTTGRVVSKDGLFSQSFIIVVE